MSMLAGPRRKQKIINLRAKNSEWSNDNTKFGQRMLEKMGWSAGKGLGAKENGIVEHVVARYKNDEKGLGFEDRNDQWTKHEDDFNSLLANLSNANDVNQMKLHSGISLEDKSKKSKARIHYHKFTRGKDLSRYSEKDLANIFGKKSFKEEEETEQSLENDVKSTEQVFTEKGSMEDYFKNKMSALKSKTNILRKEDKPTRDLEDEAMCGFQGFLETTDKEMMSENASSCNIDNNAQRKGVENDTAINEFENLSKTKKKKKKKCREVTQEVLYDNEEDGAQKVIAYAKSKRDSKDDSPIQERIPEIQEQKKCKKLRQEKNTNDDDDATEDIIYKPKKKKKRKNKDL
ncbi:unnamed protein product [Parnassius mnemosyne]|uniref:G-patch domain-containing protein n=1 Tax=Parnassius mnemosyne TaxID=213953 RepID=A0AAV1LG24_9NEOP